MVTTVAAPPVPPAKSLRRRLTELDGIRGVAAMMVVLSHTTVVVLPGGFVGVDVFFVLSGFIITGLLLDEIRANGKVRFARFWSRRATRLLPAALLVILAVAVMSMLVDNYSTRQATLDDATAGAVYLENWHLIATGSDYFGESLAPSRLRHYWSLAVEEQFYVLWPLLLAALALLARWAVPSARLAGRLLLPIAALAIASYVLAVQLDDGTGLESYMGTIPRVWQLLLGAMLAIGWRVAGTWLATRASDLLMVAGSVALLIACLYATPVTFLPWGAVIAAGGALALIAGLLEPGPWGTRVFDSAPLQYLGRVSYSIYLWHWPVIIYTDKLLGGDLNRYLLTVLEIAITLALSSATLRLLETPFRHLKVRDTRPVLVVVVAVTVSLGAALAFTAVARVDTRTVSASTGVDLQAATKDTSVRACKSEPTPCVRHTGESGLVVATVGDSTMQHYDPALRRLAQEEDFTYVQAAMGGCPIGDKFLATGVDSLHKQSNFDCRDWIPGAYEELLETYDPDVILATSSNEKAPFIGEDGSVVEPGTPEHRAATAAELSSSLELLTSKGATVVMLDQLPRGSGTDCVADAADPADCSTAVADDPTGAEYNALVREVAGDVPDVTTISLIDTVCPEGTCPAIIDGRFVRYDGGHFTGTFARDLSGELTAALAGAGVDLRPTGS